MLTPSVFRQQFPEFQDPAIYSDQVIGFWDAIALARLDADTWDDALPGGEALFVAHHLVLAARDQASIEVGGVSGGVSGLMQSKSIDKVSVSYDVSRISYEDAGFWNATSYGIRFWQLARMIGAGGVQLGAYGALGIPPYPWMV